MYSHRFLKFLQHLRHRFVALWKHSVNNLLPKPQFRQDKNTTRRIWFLAHRNLSPPIRTMAEGSQAVFTCSRSRPAIEQLFLPYFAKCWLIKLSVYIDNKSYCRPFAVGRNDRGKKKFTKLALAYGYDWQKVRPHLCSDVRQKRRLQGMRCTA